MKPWEKHISEIYYDPAAAGSFSGVNKLLKAVKRNNKFVISKAQIRRWLQEQDVHSSLRGVRRKFPRPRIMVSGPLTRNEVKSNYAERFIKTLKKKINKYFLDKQKLRYIDALQDFVDGYNNSFHRTK